ncbi:MAG: DUF4293 domain-containing protein [Bacteroidaceae bacterium]|nr:DUF4293 domain-containing protein [Bacteroidaceae bacterium]
MLQRIQTLYFLGALALVIWTACANIGRFLLPNGDIQLWGSFIWWPLAALLIVIALLQPVAIFLFRHRLLQIRIGIFSCLLIVGWYALYLWYGYFTHSVLDDTANYVADLRFAPQWTAALPAVALILLIAAIRATLRDEMLVRSLDRLR